MDKGGQITCTIDISRPGEGEMVTAHGDILLMRQHVNNGSGVHYETQVKVIATGGELIAFNKRMVIRGDDKLELRLVAATDYLGGFEIAMSWRNGTLDSFEILSLRGNPCIVGYGGKTIQLRLNEGEFIKLDGNLELYTMINNVISLFVSGLSKK